MKKKIIYYLVTFLYQVPIVFFGLIFASLRFIWLMTISSIYSCGKELSDDWHLSVVEKVVEINDGKKKDWQKDQGRDKDGRYFCKEDITHDTRANKNDPCPNCYEQEQKRKYGQILNS